MKYLTGDEFPAFIVAKPVVVIHFDAEWGAGRDGTRQAMLEANRSLRGDIAFAEVDVDRCAALAKSIPIPSVPCIAYYRDGQLLAALVGANQNIVERVKRVLRDEPIGYQDETKPTAAGTSDGSTPSDGANSRDRIRSFLHTPEDGSLNGRQVIFVIVLLAAFVLFIIWAAPQFR